MKQKDEYGAFSNLLGKITKIPHDEVKAKLEAEKRAKKKPLKKKASKRASVRVSGGKG